MKPLTTRTLIVSGIIFTLTKQLSAQTTIGTFTTVTPTAQTQSLVLPSTHTFQRIIRSGDALISGGTLGTNLDFTGYVPIAGSSRNGYLSISSETTPAAVAILDINYTTSNHRWNVSSGGNVPFIAAGLGNVSRFCSGTVTPNGTIMVSEEQTNTLDVNTDTYHDLGWIIEIDPVTRQVINQDGVGGVDKIWAMGKASRENAAVKSDRSVIYTGADDGGNSFVYKFVPTTAGVYTDGLLYVLRTTAALGNGTWKLIPNTTVGERNTIMTAAAAAPAAYSFNGVEDIEFGPDGKMYFAAKGEGKIYRFTDNNTVGTATDITGLEVFVGNSTAGRTYDIDGAGGLPLEPWGLGNDNIAFDGQGNLWVCQDAIAGTDRNHIWVVGPTHTQASPQVRVFATTPVRSEPTGITFTPDYNFMFLSFMSPNSGNTASQLDAAGTSVIFDRHTTVVIARKEFLGALSTLPLSFTAFDAKQTGAAVAVNWTVENINNHAFFVVERSVDGTNFEEISRNNEQIDGVAARSFNITDNNLPASMVVYYRIRQCDMDGTCKYTDVKMVKLSGKGFITRVYPQPVKDKLTVTYQSFTESTGTITISDIQGKTISQETRQLVKGTQSLVVKTAQLISGVYFVTIDDKLNDKTTEKFIKE